MNKYLKVLLGVFFLGLVVLASCSLSPLKNLQNNIPDSTDNIDSNLVVVGFSQLGSESDWRTANTKSIQNAFVEENGFSLIFSNGRQSQENQIKDIRSFIFQQVDYIIIAPLTETGWDTVLEEAKKAGIPVIIADRMIETKDENLYTAYVGTDKYAEGQKAGLWLEKYLSAQIGNDQAVPGDGISPATTESQPGDGQTADDINIVVLEGTLNSTAQIGRSQGFMDVAVYHKNWHILAQEDGDFTKAKGKEIMAKYLKQFADIDVLVSQNDDMTFGAIEAIQEAGLTCGVNGKIKIISFDAVAEAFDKMEAGLINVDIECNPLQGKLIAELIERLANGEQVAKVSYLEGKVFEAKNASVDRVGRTY